MALVETHIGDAHELVKHVSAAHQPSFFARLKSVVRKSRANVRKLPPSLEPLSLSAPGGEDAVLPKSKTSSPEKAHSLRVHRRVSFESDISNEPAPHVSALAPHHKMFSGSHVRDVYSFRGAELLGTGGIGSCQTVTKRTTGQVFAMKSVYIEDRHMLEEFRQECAIQRSLDHPNIVRVYESFEEGPERVHIVMELCTGGNLVQMLEASPMGLEERAVAEIAVKMLSAIYYMHQRGFVHRDIKPDNIMYESRARDAEPKLIDFGFACHVEKGAEHIKGRYGTLSYMAPELLDTAKRGAYDSSVDLWSFGVTVYTLLTSRKPFEHEERETKKRLIREASPSYTSSRWGRVSPLAVDFVKSLIQKDPSRRLSASQALQHPWLQHATSSAIVRAPSSARSSGSSGPLPPQLVQSLLAYSSASLLTRMALEVIAFSLLPHQLREERTVFTSIDADRSGTVSRSEFVGAISSQLGLPNTAVEEIFSVLDVNRSGQLDFNEFCAAAVRCKLLSLADRQVIESAFRLLDKDNDGLVTLTDLQATFSKQELSDSDLGDLMRWFGSTYEGLDLEDFWHAATATGRFATRARTRARPLSGCRIARCDSSPARRASSASKIKVAHKRVLALRNEAGAPLAESNRERRQRQHRENKAPQRPPSVRSAGKASPPRIVRFYSEP